MRNLANLHYSTQVYTMQRFLLNHLVFLIPLVALCMSPSAITLMHLARGLKKHSLGLVWLFKASV
jgi:hypothetical protein